jgi:hypothetical protein
MARRTGCFSGIKFLQFDIIYISNFSGCIVSNVPIRASKGESGNFLKRLIENFEVGGGLIHVSTAV